MKYLSLILALTACASVRTQPTPQPLTAPPIYAEWYRQLEQCSGIKGDFKAVDFYVATNTFHNGHHFNGYWQLGSIVLAPNKLNDRAIVQHEMMHDITQSPVHKRTFFKGVCGDISTGEELSE